MTIVGDICKCPIFNFQNYLLNFGYYVCQSRGVWNYIILLKLNYSFNSGYHSDQSRETVRNTNRQRKNSKERPWTTVQCRFIKTA